MKITLVNATDSGGAGVATMRLYAALKKQGVDVKVLLQKVKKQELLANADVATWIRTPLAKALYGVRHLKEKKLVGKGSGWQNFSSGMYGVSAASHPFVDRADIVHLHWINDNFISIEGLKSFGKPLTWTFHDMWPYTSGHHYEDDHKSIQMPEKTDSGLEMKIWEKKKFIYPSVNLTCVTPSRWLGNLAEQAPVLSGKSVHAIPNPIDPDVYKPKSKQVSRKAFDISEDAFVILFGSFNELADERKGFLRLKEALDLVKKEIGESASKIELAVIGRRNDELAAQVPFKVHFLGFHNSDEALAKCYNVADVFALPSSQDNLPNMCMEALSCGIPVVGFNIGGVPDMVIEGRTGFLATLGQSSEMADALVQLFLRPELRSDMSQNAREHVLSQFSEEVVGKKMLTLYRSLLS